MFLLLALLGMLGLQVQTHIPGDYNNDGIVDIRDYGVWRQNFGATDCGNPADGDGNCIVDIRDYGIWRFHFGRRARRRSRPRRRRCWSASHSRRPARSFPRAPPHARRLLPRRVATLGSATT
jgi:hypothetical protein